MPIPLIARHLAQSGAVNFHARVILGLGHRLGRDSRMLQVAGGQNASLRARRGVMGLFSALFFSYPTLP